MAIPTGGKVIGYPPKREPQLSINTVYDNDSNIYRLDFQGHSGNKTPHGHAHLKGRGPHNTGQGYSLDINGDIVDAASKAAHFYNVKAIGILSFFSPFIHMSTFGSCKKGSIGQCFCAMSKEIEYNIDQNNADTLCGYTNLI
ncbi:hypothetical protein [Superficieibacter sp. 1612_C1]|uniref:hypothetical protein n=1 Tax=Superficieibacter sp. 1612_C1 TaxID=2780382 RepID=UPI0018831988|nr:hypothetical protein [Superficieibacter sp. 1612_C1]